MRISAIRLMEGEQLPWWLGIAWQCPNAHAYIALPLGIHWIAGWTRRWWHEFKIGYRGTSAITDAAERCFKEGAEFGRRQSAAYEYQRGYEHGIDQTLRIFVERTRSTK